MSHYAAGAAFERKVRDRLYAEGAALVVRSAGSKGPVDLVAFFPCLVCPLPVVQFVQVKRGRRGMTKAARAELAALSESIGATPILASPEKNGRRIDVKLEVLT